MHLCLVVQGCHSREHRSYLEDLPEKQPSSAVIKSPTAKQELHLAFDLSPKVYIEYKFCDRQELCPIFRARAGQKVPLVFDAPSSYSARLCKRQNRQCQDWQLLLIHAVKELETDDMRPQKAESLAFRQDSRRGFAINILGGSNLVYSQYLLIDDLQVERTDGGLRLVEPVGIPNLGNTCYLNSLLQILSRTKLSDRLKEAKDAMPTITSQDDATNKRKIWNFLSSLQSILSELKTSSESLGEAKIDKLFETWNTFKPGTTLEKSQQDTIEYLSSFISEAERVGFEQPNHVTIEKVLDDFETTTPIQLEEEFRKQHSESIDIDQEILINFGRTRQTTVLEGENPTSIAYKIKSSVQLNWQEGSSALFSASASADASSDPSHHLKTAVVHIGDDPSSGHYITYTFEDGDWWKISDNEVTRVEGDTNVKDMRAEIDSNATVFLFKPIAEMEADTDDRSTKAPTDMEPLSPRTNTRRGPPYPELRSNYVSTALGAVITIGGFTLGSILIDQAVQAATAAEEEEEDF